MDIKDILQECFSENLSDYKNNLFLFVRDIPYEMNDARSPELLLKIWKWYCVPKHRLLKILFDKIGVQSKLCFVPFKFNQIYLPPDLQDWWFADKLWYHVFLKVLVEDTYINVDASFPLALDSFYHVNDNWDWVSSQMLTIWESGHEYIANNLDEESTIKSILSDSRWLGPQDYLRIKKYNQRLSSIYSINRKRDV